MVRFFDLKTLHGFVMLALVSFSSCWNDVMAQTMPNENAMAQQMATRLSSGDISGLAFSGQLDRSRLDYSLESLKTIDKYLKALHDSLPKVDGKGDISKVPQAALKDVIFHVGAYVGEVVRRHQTTPQDWYLHKVWIGQFPKHAPLIGDQPSLGTVVLIGSSDGNFSLPLSKVGKFVMNGEEDSVHWFAQAILSPRDDKK